MTSRRMVSPRALAFTLVPSVSLALLASLAQAQTAPRYTARELPKVASSVVCGIGVAINEAGDVSQNCLYNSGSYSTTQDVCYEYLGFCYKTRITQQINYLLPAVWPASGGSARALSTTARSYSTGTIVSGGAVVGRSAPIGSRGETIGAAQFLRWLPPYSAVGQLEPVPAALQNAGYAQISGLTKGGAIWWSNPGGTQHAVAGVDGRVWFVPSPPPLTDAAESVSEDLLLAVQDGLQVIRGRWITAFQSNGQTSYRYEAWYLRDQQWTRIPLRSDQVRLDAVSIASSGLVLFSQGGASYTWLAEQSAQLSALALAGGGKVLNASGLVGGAVPIPNDRKFRTKAQIWWQGQALDLQGLVTGLPRGLQLRSVEALNDRGQLVVQAEQTSIFASANNPVYKTLLLTPQ